MGIVRAILVAAAIAAVCGCGADSNAPRYTLTDADKATLIHAARLLAEYEDPAEVGSPERVQSFRRLAERIEGGELGVRWPTFRVAVHYMASLTAMSARWPAEDRESSDHERAQREEFTRFCTALDAGDVPEAHRSYEAWATHLPKLDEARVKSLLAPANR